MIDDEVGQECLRKLVESVDVSDAETSDGPVLTNSWTSETLDAEREPVRVAVEQSDESDSAEDDRSSSKPRTETEVGRDATENANDSNGTTTLHQPLEPSGRDDQTEYDDFDVMVTDRSGNLISDVSVRIADGEWDSERKTNASGVASFKVPSDVRKLNLTLDHPEYETKKIERYRRESEERSLAEFSLPANEDGGKPDSNTSDRESSGTSQDGLVNDTGTEAPSGSEDATTNAASEQMRNRSEPERVSLKASTADEGEKKPKDGSKSGPIPQDLKDELHRLADEFGHPPRPSDADTYGRYPMELYREEFGPWDQTLDAVDMDIDDAWPNPNDYDDVLLDTYVELGERLGHDPSERNVDEIGRFDAVSYTNRWGNLSEVEEIISEIE
jgi:hypothetical protein